MKAAQDFELVLDKNGNPTPYYEGDSKEGLKFIKLKKGDEVPEDQVQQLVNYLPEVLDISYKEGRMQLPEGVEKKSKPVVSHRKYTEEDLTKIFNKEGMAGLKEIGKEFINKEGDGPVTDRSSTQLIKEILIAQKEERFAKKKKEDK